MSCARRPLAGLVLSLLLIGGAPTADARLILDMRGAPPPPSLSDMFDELGWGPDEEEDEAEGAQDGTLAADLLGLAPRGAMWAQCRRSKRDVLRIGHGAAPDGRPQACRQASLWRAWGRRYDIVRRPRVRIRLAREMPMLRMPMVAGSSAGLMGAAVRGRFARTRGTGPGAPPVAHYGFLFTALFVLRGPASAPVKPPAMPASPKSAILSRSER